MLRLLKRQHYCQPPSYIFRSCCVITSPRNTLRAANQASPHLCREDWAVYRIALWRSYRDVAPLHNTHCRTLKNMARGCTPAHALALTRTKHACRACRELLPAVLPVYVVKQTLTRTSLPGHSVIFSPGKTPHLHLATCTAHDFRPLRYHSLHRATLHAARFPARASPQLNKYLPSYRYPPASARI